MKNIAPKTIDYLPGNCNLGRKETNRRKLQAIGGLTISVLFITISQACDSPSIFRFFLFAPFFYTIICFLQAREKFCVVFGINGVYNFSEERKLVKVNEEEYRMKDRKKALRILFLSFAIAFLITVIYFYLPV